MTTSRIVAASIAAVGVGVTTANVAGSLGVWAGVIGLLVGIGMWTWLVIA